MVEVVNRTVTLRLVIARSFVYLIIAMSLGFLFNTYLHDLLQELSEIRASDVIGAMGTIYALITAFILVNVWQGLTETQNSLASENAAIVQIWSYVDYFDDVEFSKNMKKVLMSYITLALRELVDLSKENTVIFPSEKFTNILKVIDSVKFDDPRDPIAFQWLADIEQPGDGVVITYSGHGSYDRRTAVSMLVSTDLRGVTTDEIKPITDQIETEHVYFFDDACNQGTMQDLAQPGWVMAIGSTTSTYTYDGDASMAMGVFTYYMREALYIPLTIVEVASNYAITEFEIDTPGDAFLIDTYIGDFFF